MRLTCAILLLLLTGCLKRYPWPRLVERESAVELTVFVDAAVFDGLHPELLEHQDVFVQGDRIVKLAPHGEVVLTPGTRQLDGRGKTLLPGFVDFHVHLTGSAAPPWNVTWPDADHTGAALLYSGVTTAQDVGGEADAIEAVHQRLDAGTWLGPDFTYAGSLITARDSYPASMVRELFPWPINRLAEGKFATQVGTPDEARAAVTLQAAHGASHIKVAVAQVPLDVPVLSSELLGAVVGAARAKGLRVVAHVDTAEHALLAARAGVAALVHGVHLGELTDAQAAELKALGTVVAPTLVVWDRVEQLAEFRYAPTPLEQELFPADFLAAYAPEVARTRSLPDGLTSWIRALQASKPQRLEAVRRLAAAGVPLLVGADDSGSTGCTAGAAFHEELRLLAEAGVPPLLVLQGATSTAARFLAGPDADFGTIAVGHRADLVLVQGNPLQDLAAASRIAAVMKHGVLIRRTAGR